MKNKFGVRQIKKNSREMEEMGMKTSLECVKSKPAFWKTFLFLVSCSTFPEIRMVRPH